MTNYQHTNIGFEIAIGRILRFVQGCGVSDIQHSFGMLTNGIIMYFQ